PFENRALREAEAVLAGQAELELLPDPVVRPGLGILVGVALEVHPLDVGGPLADEREAVRRPRVDQLGGAGRCLDEDAEPRIRVLAEILMATLDQGTRRPTGAVAPDDEVGHPPLHLPL